MVTVTLLSVGFVQVWDSKGGSSSSNRIFGIEFRNVSHFESMEKD